MKRLSALLTLSLLVGANFATVTTAAAQPPITVLVDGSPMNFPDQPPIDRAGRLYVPIRAIFERLGASVVYNNGTINATRGHRMIQLQIGEPSATVDGQQVQLDSPPFEIGARTLVPLRFVSQGLGAHVSWDQNRMTAYIVTGGMGGAMPPGPGAMPPPDQTGSSMQQPGPAWADAGHPLLHRPYPWGSTSQTFPLVNVSFRRALRPESVHIMLDGRSVTEIAKITPMGFEFTPAYHLHPGVHEVRISGVTQDGAPVSDGWSFTVTP